MGCACAAVGTGTKTKTETETKRLPRARAGSGRAPRVARAVGTYALALGGPLATSPARA